MEFTFRAGCTAMAANVHLALCWNGVMGEHWACRVWRLKAGIQVQTQHPES